MIVFVFGTLLILAFLAWGTFQTAQFLRQFPVNENLLLLPAENILRMALLVVCLWLGQVSGLPYAQLGWISFDPARDVTVGLFAGTFLAVFLPPFTQWAVKRFGRHVYSPVVVRSILPRSRREWLFVPPLLLSAVLLEEFLFRSFLLGGFGSFASPVFLALIWSIVFGAMHVPQGALGVLVAALLGLLLSGLFLATKSLLAPLVAHYVINLLQLIWASLDKSWLESYGDMV